MPDSKHKKTARIARRRRVAAGLVEGREIKEIAASERVSTRTVLRDLRDPQTTELLSGLVARHGPELERLFVRSLHAVDDALDAETIDGGQRSADHRSRLWAVQQLARMMQVCAARPGTDGQDQRRGWTWTELKQVWMEAQRG